MKARWFWAIFWSQGERGGRGGEGEGVGVGKGLGREKCEGEGERVVR